MWIHLNLKVSLYHTSTRFFIILYDFFRNNAIYNWFSRYDEILTFTKLSNVLNMILKDIKAMSMVYMTEIEYYILI